MARRTTFEATVEIPHGKGLKLFRDVLAGAWSLCGEPPIGALESAGLGITWWTRAGECTRRATLPLPWAFVRDGLVERLAIDKTARLYFLRSEIIFIRRSDERPRLLVHMERK